MAAIYMLSSYGKLGKKDDTLIFHQPGGESITLFPYKIECLILIGNISISGEALRILAKYKIPTILLSSNGIFNGKITFGESKNVFLRQKQYAVLSNESQSLEIAKSIVVGKIKNQLSFVQRIKRKSEDNLADKKIQLEVYKLKSYIVDCDEADSIEKLRGLEGISARSYFSVFGLNILPEWADFPNRSKNPPKTNVNAVLSFLYTLLMYRVEGAIMSQGLDYCCGNLHALTYGKSALVFDLMEEFRTPIADTVCCSLFNLGILKEDDFEEVDFSSKNDDYPLEIENEEPKEEVKTGKGILLTKDGIKKVVGAFEDKINSLVFYPPTEEKKSYIKIIYEQAAHYKTVISGENSSYKPYYFK